jgi:hypothetical protein
VVESGKRGGWGCSVVAVGGMNGERDERLLRIQRGRQVRAGALGMEGAVARTPGAGGAWGRGGMAKSPARKHTRYLSPPRTPHASLTR